MYIDTTPFLKVDYENISTVELTKMVRELVPLYRNFVRTEAFSVLPLDVSLRLAKLLKAVAVENKRLGVIRGRTIKKELK